MALLVYSLISVSVALARGGHSGEFMQVSHDPATHTRIVIEFYVPPPGKTEGGWTRVIAYDDGKKWVRLEKPIAVDGKGNLEEPLFKSKDPSNGTASNGTSSAQQLSSATPYVSIIGLLVCCGAFFVPRLIRDRMYRKARFSSKAAP